MAAPQQGQQQQGQRVVPAFSQPAAAALPVPSVTKPFQCGDCGCVFRAAGGSAVKCPGCHATIDVPSVDLSQLPGGPTIMRTRTGTDLQVKAQREQVQTRQMPGQGVERVVGHPWVTALRSVAEWQWAIPAPGACDEHLVFLMIGGINMVGRAMDCPAVIRKPLSGPAWHCDSAGRMNKGCGEPMHPMDGVATGVGVGRSFARRLLRNIPRHGVFLCPSACGSGDTSMNAWRPDGVLYSIAVARGRTCATAVGGRVAAVIWHGGEADACTQEDTDKYEERMRELLHNLRTDFDNPDLPIVLGEIGESFLCPQSAYPEAHKRARDINQVLRKLGHMHQTECVLAPASCHSDKLSFDAGGMEEYGTRYAEAWERLWTNMIRDEQRIGPDGKPHTKVSWIRTVGGLCTKDEKHIWASAPRYNKPVEEGRDRRRRRRGDGEDGGRRRRRRDEDGEEGGRRRRRREEKEAAEGESAMKDKLMKTVITGLSVAAAQAGNEGGAAGDKEEDEALRRAAGFDDSIKVACGTGTCDGQLQPVPQILDEHGQCTAACDGADCGKEMVLLRAMHSGWLCCLKCDKGFCQDCVAKRSGSPKKPQGSPAGSPSPRRDASPDARMPGAEA